MNEKSTIAAFFDLDGTIVAPPSLEWRFALHLAIHRKLHARAVLQWLRIYLKEGMKGLLAGADAPAQWKAVDENKAYLAGVDDRLANDWTEENVATLDLYPDALARLAWHRGQGHELFLVSGTLAFLARAVAAHLARSGEIGVAATELESFAGFWTGRVAGAAVCGPAKARAVRELAARQDLDLTRSFAYGDSFDDRWMLGTVGNATVVNPSARLMWLAVRRGWRIAWWPRPECGSEMPREQTRPAQEVNPVERTQGNESKEVSEKLLDSNAPPNREHERLIITGFCFVIFGLSNLVERPTK